jgi:hypothetical protein
MMIMTFIIASALNSASPKSARPATGRGDDARVLDLSPADYAMAAVGAIRNEQQRETCLVIHRLVRSRVRSRSRSVKISEASTVNTRGAEIG